VITIVPLPFTFAVITGCPLAPFLFLPFKFVAVPSVLNTPSGETKLPMRNCTGFPDRTRACRPG